MKRGARLAGLRPPAPPLSAEEIRDVNTRYHDVAADHYDHKWGIDFGDLGHDQVLAKVRKALHGKPGHYPRSLEIGSGTGYFTLNMMRAGLIDEATCSDISPGMLASLAANAERLGLQVQTVPADAEALPFADESFDLVLGHAILHHIPDLPQAFSRVRARARTRAARCCSPVSPPATATAWRTCPSGPPARLRRCGAARFARAPRHRPIGGAPDSALEGVVDVHAFAPAELSAFAKEAGFTDVRVTGEELLANWFGWTNRTLEATADPFDVPWAWRQYAYRGYLLFQELDRRLLESRLPPAIFYNLLIAARKPAE